MEEPTQVPEAGAAMVVVDAMNELYLHHSDHPNYVLSTRLLNERNYSHWKRSVEVSLMAKNKLGFVTGTCAKPVPSSPILPYWERCNNMVISWLLHSVEKDIAETVLYNRTAKQIWKELGERVGKSNRTRVYQIQRETSGVSQGNLSIANYFNKMKKLWDEYMILVESQICACGSIVAVTNLIKEQQVVQFLMGLNYVYNGIRGSILMMSPSPNIHEVYKFLLQEEEQRGMNKDLGGSGVDVDSVALASQRYRAPRKPVMFCEHCKVSGHVIEKCWKVHGYPPGMGQGASRPNSSAYCEHCKMTGHTMEMCWKPWVSKQFWWKSKQF